MDAHRFQAWVLRLVGIVEVLAFASAVMPEAWMAESHAWLGLGDLSDAPAVEAVMRQVSFTYGLHGIGLLVIASDVVRYRPLVVMGTAGYLVYGVVFLVTDIGLGMPRLCVVGNGGSCLLIGALLIGSLWAAHRQEARS
jgi:hypothetical protein